MTTYINDIEKLAARIDTQFPFSTDRTNYGSILRSVASKKIVYSIIRDIVIIIGGISKQPYNMSDCKIILVGYMNECIANAFENSYKPKIEQFCEAYVNIREHANAKEIKDRIVQSAIKMGLDVEQAKNKIDQTLEKFQKHFKKLLLYPYNSNGYNQYLPICKTEVAELLNYNYDPYGISYSLRSGYDIFTDVKKKKLEEERKAIEQKKKEYELREKEREKSEEKRREEIQFKKEQRIFWIKIVLGILVFIGFIAFIIWLASHSSGDDDGTVGNWFMAILCLLAWLKGGKR